MLDLHVVPERSLGNEQWKFALGMPLFQAVQILQIHCRIIKSVEVTYNDKHPIDSDLVLNLTNDGIKLIFDSVIQRLKIIEVYNMSKVKLKYCGIYFNSPQFIPTLDQIDQSFGATHPGQFDPNLQLFVLTFRGLTFFFPVNSQFENYYKHSNTHVFPTIPPSSMPVVSKMCIYTGNHLNETRSPPMPVSCTQGNLYLDCAEVIFSDKQCDGLKLHLTTAPDNMTASTIQKLEKKIRFGDCVQKVLSDLGCPCKIFYKLQDKMRIHSTSPVKLNETRHTDYFYNYFTLGMDILFDGQSHQVKKFLLHTNFPGHYNFNIYHRCEFNIELKEEDNSTTSVRTCSKWDEVTSDLGYDIGKPVVLNRASSTNNTNPFGATFCYGLRNMVFEVMTNNYIASVTLYRPQRKMTGLGVMV